MLRVVRTNPLDDQVFGSDVGFGDEVDVALRTDLRTAEFLDQQVSGFTRDLSGEVKHFIEFLSTDYTDLQSDFSVLSVVKNGILISLSRAVCSASS